MLNAWDILLTHRLRTRKFVVHLLGPSTYRFQAPFRTPISYDDVYKAIQTHRNSQRDLEPPNMCSDESWDSFHYQVDEKALVIKVERPSKERRSSIEEDILWKARKATIEATRLADDLHAKSKAEAGRRLESARTDWNRQIQSLGYDTLVRVNLCER